MAAPFLGSVTDRRVKAEAAAPPKRLVVMFTHAGCITTKFFPRSAHGRLAVADLEATTLRHLAPYVQKLLLPRGIRAMKCSWHHEHHREHPANRHVADGGQRAHQQVLREPDERPRV